MLISHVPRVPGHVSPWVSEWHGNENPIMLSQMTSSWDRHSSACQVRRVCQADWLKEQNMFHFIFHAEGRANCGALNSTQVGCTPGARLLQEAYVFAAGGNNPTLEEAVNHPSFIPIPNFICKKTSRRIFNFAGVHAEIDPRTDLPR